MRPTDKVTNSSEEVTFTELTGGLNQLTIPLFQREYVWASRQFQRFIEDIDAVMANEDDTRFLGAIVAIDRVHTPGKIKQLELVDGQQRLTTIYMTIMAAAHCLAEHGDCITAREYIEAFLVLSPRGKGGGSPTKLVPSFADRSQFASIWTALLKNHDLASELKECRITPTPPAPSGVKIGSMTKQFTAIHAWLANRCKAKNVAEVKKIVDIATTKLSFVWLILNDPASAPKIFESLNDRGVKTTVGSLVRNEIFSRLSEDAAEALSVYESKWKPFQEQFGPTFERFFFPYCLIRNKNIKKSELFDELRRQWKDEEDAGEIIKRMDQYSAEFLLLERNQPIPNLDDDVALRVSRLHRLGAPNSVYPFIMRLTKQVRREKVETASAIETYDVVESFLFRRAICGYEPTGLHAVFKGLWDEIGGHPSAKSVTEQLLKRKTVPWPNDEEFKEAIASGDLYSRVVNLYAVTEYEASLGADLPDNVPQIEHILPQKVTAEWKKAGWTIAEHERLVDTWANLIPNSPGMNKGCGQRPFKEKRKWYSKKSMYASARAVAKEDEWTPEKVARRSKLIQAWAVERWKY